MRHGWRPQQSAGLCLKGKLNKINFWPKLRFILIILLLIFRKLCVYNRELEYKSCTENIKKLILENIKIEQNYNLCFWKTCKTPTGRKINRYCTNLLQISDVFVEIRNFCVVSSVSRARTDEQIWIWGYWMKIILLLQFAGGFLIQYFIYWYRLK